MSKNSYKYYEVDLTGAVHERLTIIRKANTGRTRWVCQCTCGKIIELTPYKFYKNKSCGCLEKENLITLGQNNKTHGMTETILYHKYLGMKHRCYCPSYKYYQRYGGRGISVCDEWLGEHGFENFTKWAYNNGYDDSKHTFEQTLDRIDLDGNYEPSNCRWVDMKIQCNNRRTSRFLYYKDEKLTVAQFCEKFHINKSWFVARRLDKGKSPEDILLEWSKKNDKG